jgi:hypothetical protein
VIDLDLHYETYHDGYVLIHVDTSEAFFVDRVSNTGLGAIAMVSWTSSGPSCALLVIICPAPTSFEVAGKRVPASAFTLSDQSLSGISMRVSCVHEVPIVTDVTLCLINAQVMM